MRPQLVSNSLTPTCKRSEWLINVFVFSNIPDHYQLWLLIQLLLSKLCYGCIKYIVFVSKNENWLVDGKAPLNRLRYPVKLEANHQNDLCISVLNNVKTDSVRHYLFLYFLLCWIWKQRHIMEKGFGESDKQWHREGASQKALEIERRPFRTVLYCRKNILKDINVIVQKFLAQAQKRFLLFF